MSNSVHWNIGLKSNSRERRCHFTYAVEAKEWAIAVDARFNFQILVKSNFFAKYFTGRQWPPPCCLQSITPYFYTHLSFLKGIFLTIIFLSSLSIPIFLDWVSWWASKAYKAIRLNHHCLNNSFSFLAHQKWYLVFVSWCQARQSVHMDLNIKQNVWCI